MYCIYFLYIWSANILVLLREEAFWQELDLAVLQKYMVDATTLADISAPVCGVGNSG